jgi:uncharacterized protein (DUF983 family)
VPDTIPVSALTVPKLATAPVRWQPDRAEVKSRWANVPLPQMLLRGLAGRCPSCGESHIFNGYLTVAPECSACNAPLGQVRADDVPPYFTILVAGHIIVPLMLWLERAYTPALWIHAAIWLPVTLGLCLGLLRPIKGATVGLMLKLGMFRPESEA